MKRPSSAKEDDEETDDGVDAGVTTGSACATVSVSDGSLRFIETHSSGKATRCIVASIPLHQVRRWRNGCPTLPTSSASGRCRTREKADFFALTCFALTLTSEALGYRLLAGPKTEMESRKQ